MATITTTEQIDQLHAIIIKEEQKEFRGEVEEQEMFREETTNTLYGSQEMDMNDVKSIKVEKNLFSTEDRKSGDQNILNYINEEEYYNESFKCKQFQCDKLEGNFDRKVHENIFIKYEINDGLHSALIIKKEMEENELNSKDGIIFTDNEEKNDSGYSYLEDVETRYNLMRDECEPCSSFTTQSRTEESISDLDDLSDSDVNLITHDKINLTKKILKCDKCEKYFNHMSDLKRHSMIHTGEKPFKCDKCEKNFNHIGTLNRHALIHTGDKPFKCDKCEKSFTLRNSLKRHGIVHSGEKPFKCNICEKRFTQSGDLKKHAMIHTKEKPFKCDICEKTFNQKEYLKKHNRIHEKT